MKNLLIVATLSITVAAVIKRVACKKSKHVATVVVDITKIQEMLSNYRNALNAIE